MAKKAGDEYERGQVAAHAMLRDDHGVGGLAGGRIVAFPFEQDHTVIAVRAVDGEIMLTNEECRWFAGYLKAIAERRSMPDVRVPSQLTGPLLKAVDDQFQTDKGANDE